MSQENEARRHQDLQINLAVQKKDPNCLYVKAGFGAFEPLGECMHVCQYVCKYAVCFLTDFSRLCYLTSVSADTFLADISRWKPVQAAKD